LRLEEERVLGGPSWIRSSEYQIEAKKDGARRDQMPLMLQTLLADRFKLRVHWETRDLPVYELTVAKGGSKLEQWKEGSCVSPSNPSLGPGGEIPGFPPSAQALGSPLRWNPKAFCGVYFRSMRSVGYLYAGKASMADLIAQLQFFASDRTIIDKTGVTKPFNAILVFQHQGPNEPLLSDSGVALPTALQEQLGLKLQSVKGAVSVLVIDSADRPSEN
jgi:uncharacterized protein (TIGR03435 family)